MGMRLEVDVERCAASFVAGGFEGEDLGVLFAAVGVTSRADYIAFGVGDDRADVRDWARRVRFLRGRVPAR